MIRACVTCYGFAGWCHPATEDPVDPMYAADCQAYKPIPEKVFLMLAERAPGIYKRLKDMEKEDGNES